MEIKDPAPLRRLIFGVLTAGRGGSFTRGGIFFRGAKMGRRSDLRVRVRARRAHRDASTPHGRSTRR